MALRESQAEIKNVEDARFSKHSTGLQVVAEAGRDRGSQFAGKVALITGANTGIGLESAVALATAGCTVVLACRSREKAEKAAADVAARADVARDKVVPAVIECSSLASVRAFAKEFLAGNVVPGARLHIVVNNAGIMQTPVYTESEDGYEMQFAVNFLAGFLLVDLLTPALQRCSTRADPARVVNVSSVAHELYPRKLNVSELPVAEDRYAPFVQYGESKLLQILHAKALNARLAHGEQPVLAFALHPGIIMTGLTRSVTRCSVAWWAYAFPTAALWLGLHKTLEAGAGPTVRCCLDPALGDLDGGELPVYFNDDCQPRTPRLPADADKQAMALMQRAAALVRASAGGPGKP